MLKIEKIEKKSKKSKKESLCKFFIIYNVYLYVDSLL